MISKQPTIDDIYNFDAYISTPGVREGLMQRATLDDAEFTLEDTDDGQAMFFNTPHGEQMFVGMPEKTMPGRQEGDVLMAAGPSQTVSDSAPPIRVGRAGVPFKGPSMSDITEPAKAMADMFAGAFKGAVQGFTGTPGELEGFIYGLKELATRNADTSMLDAFVKGYEQKTILPKTEEVKKWLDKNVGTATSYENPFETVGEVVAPGGQVKAGKAVVKGTVRAAKALAPEVGQAVVKSMEKLGTPLQMNIVEPSKFNPKVELPKAVDIVANDPSLNTFLPQAQRAPSVALRLTKPEIKGTGGKGALTVSDIGLVLEKSQLSLNNGKILDPTKPKDLVKMVDSASAEAEYQMSQPISGATWYEDDVFQAFALGSKIVPELATDEPLRVMATAFAASTSYNKRASENWSVAMRITEDMMKTGKVPSRNPDNGKLWGGTTGPIMEKQLKLHEFLMGTMGMDNYAEWLLTPHTVKEISEMKAASGLYKDSSIPGKASDMKMGAFIIGEKGGAFFLNLNGIKETTADKWFSRTYNRHTGTLTTGPLSDQGLVDTPRNESERSVMKVWNRSVADNMKLDEQANQAVLWYYEQSLYYNLGIKSARSESFSDGAKTLLNARGIPFTAAELAGARGRSNAGQVAAEPPSAAGAGDTVSLGQAAPAQPAATPTTVKRGRGAPTSGAK